MKNLLYIYYIKIIDTIHIDMLYIMWRIIERTLYVYIYNNIYLIKHKIIKIYIIIFIIVAKNNDKNLIKI